MDKTMLTVAETADYLAAHGLAISQHTLNEWRGIRGRGRGPRFVKIEGSIVRYPVADLDRWLVLQVEDAGSNPANGDGREDKVAAPE
jgi:hypothetical protein